MRRSLYISTAIHAAILIWVALGDGLFKDSPDPVFEVTGVALISTAEFDVMFDQSPPIPEPQTAPEQRPDPPEPPPPEPDPVPQAEPEPQPEPQPDPTPPGEVTDTLAPPAPVSGAPDLPPGPRPTPRAADRIAPLPTPAPEQDVAVAPEVMTETAEPAPAETPAPVQEQAAPEEATTQIVTEADTPSGGPLGPIASIRPPTRPERPRPAEPTAAPEAPAPEQPPRDPLADAIASAVASAVNTPSAPSGPPLTAGARDGFRVAVQTCWNIGSLSNEAQRTTVVVGFDMTREARPVEGSLRMISYEGGSQAAAQQAFEAARRAILRCGMSGYGLPVESYEHWQQVELVFNPEGMRLR